MSTAWEYWTVRMIAAKDRGDWEAWRMAAAKRNAAAMDEETTRRHRVLAGTGAGR